MKEVWLELKYGSYKNPITIYRLSDQQIIQAFRRKALKEADWRARESEVIDPVIGIMDRFELERLGALLDMLVPVSGNDSR